MLTLAFDTSSSQGGVAVLDDSKLLSRIVWEREGSHGELLTPAIEQSLKNAQVKPEALDLIALGHGPGSFTGVRIAVNAARALAYANETPLMAFDSTEILAAGVAQHEFPVLALIDAQKNLLFASSFSWRDGAWERTSALETLELEALIARLHEPHICVGDGYLEFAELIPNDAKDRFVRRQGLSDHPLPEVIGQLAVRSRGKRPALSWRELQALYIRASGAEETLEAKRKRTDPSER